MRNKLFCSTTMVNLDWSLVLNVAQNHFSKVLTRHFSVASQFIFSCVCLLSILPSLKKQQTSDSSMPVRSLPASAKIIKLRCKLFRAWETAGTAWWLMLSACNQAALMSQSSKCHRTYSAVIRPVCLDVSHHRLNCILCFQDTQDLTYIHKHTHIMPKGFYLLVLIKSGSPGHMMMQMYSSRLM